MHTTDTLVGVNGVWVVAPYVAFLCLSGIAWLGLHASCTTGSHHGRTVGNVAAGLLAAAAVLSFSLGFLTVPGALFVVVAAALTPRARQAREM